MQHHEKTEYLTGQCLPSALHFLRAVECDDVNPFTPALSAWQGAPEALLHLLHLVHLFPSVRPKSHLSSS